MTPLFTTARIALVAFGALSFQASEAGAVSASVKIACMGDYLSYCSQHAIGSPGLRQCMSSHGENLSKRCVSALVAAGEVSQTEVDRRKSATQRASNQ